MTQKESWTTSRTLGDMPANTHDLMLRLLTRIRCFVNVLHARSAVVIEREICSAEELGSDLRA